MHAKLMLKMILFIKKSKEFFIYEIKGCIFFEMISLLYIYFNINI